MRDVFDSRCWSAVVALLVMACISSVCTISQLFSMSFGGFISERADLVLQKAISAVLASQRH